MRFAEIFERYRYVAFIERHDQLFKEHWTPEMAASGYRFSRFELCDGRIVLHGTEAACGFMYRISIAFPEDLVDTPEAINSYFEKSVRKPPSPIRQVKLHKSLIRQSSYPELLLLPFDSQLFELSHMPQQWHGRTRSFSAVECSRA